MIRNASALPIDTMCNTVTHGATPDEVGRLGRPGRHKPLSDGIAGLLRQTLGISGDNVPAVGLADVRLRPSALSPPAAPAWPPSSATPRYADDDRSRLLRAEG